VRLADRYNNPVSGIVVRFEGTRGLEPGFVFSVTTDLHGIARANSWILGPVPGTHSITVKAADLNPLVIEAVALAAGDIVAVYDVLTIDSRSPSLWSVSQATVSLASTGHFLDATFYANGFVWESSGKYTLTDSNVTLNHFTGLTERGTVNPTVLSLLREDYYSLPKIWAFTRRK
jgi:hypothetical protein